MHSDIAVHSKNEDLEEIDIMNAQILNLTADVEALQLAASTKDTELETKERSIQHLKKKIELMCGCGLGSIELSELDQLEEAIISTLGSIRREKTRRIENSTTFCSICMENNVDIVFSPCGHMCVCSECWDNFEIGSKCPVCRKIIELSIKVYR
eukprot:TRINITY_DN3541_c0_g1_i1.p1 TRINITY_DN3541_c0_g1~~TRINITY_DN3541_c0_g1_i1.p1  ORF type:complete len:154 (+),score=29.46 TRINITY_DN3541_c0_g1_i1:106-567(+)